MKQKFTAKVIGLENLKTAKVEIVRDKLHPKYHKPLKIRTTKNVHYEVTEKEIVNWLTQYFQKNQVKEISLKKNELVITYNNNETTLLEKIIKKHEIWNVKDYLLKTKQSYLTAEKLKELNASDSSQTELPLQLGDEVKIEVCSPRSKTKRFLVSKKL